MSVNTSCQECVFAVYQGKTQTDCHLGRLEKFRELGCVVEAYNEQGEFYVIDGRVCLGYRRGDNPTEGGAWNQLPMEVAVERARRQMRLRLAVFVMAHGATPEEVALTVASLAKQTLRPVEVMVFSDCHAEAAAAIREVAGELDWRMVVPTVSMTRGMAIDQCAGLMRKGFFYTVFNAGFEVPTDFASRIDEVLEGECGRFCLLTPLPSGDGLVVQLSTHSHPDVCGNSPAYYQEGEEVVDLPDIATKVTHMAATAGTPEMVRSVMEVVPSLGVSCPK